MVKCYQYSFTMHNNELYIFLSHFLISTANYYKRRAKDITFFRSKLLTAHYVQAISKLYYSYTKVFNLRKHSEEVFFFFLLWESIKRPIWICYEDDALFLLCISLFFHPGFISAQYFNLFDWIWWVAFTGVS